MNNLFTHLRSILAEGRDPVDQEQEIWAKYGRRVSVMVLDSTGFSRVSEAHGILHFLSRLVLMREIVKPILAENDAQLFKFEADNAFAVFAHPDQAIKAALAVHAKVESEKLMLTDSEPFRVCIGIGYGEMLYSETLEGYFGEEMNLASKLGEDTAEGGDTLITGAAYAAASSALASVFEQHQVSVSGILVDYYRMNHRLA